MHSHAADACAVVTSLPHAWIPVVASLPHALASVAHACAIVASLPHARAGALRVCLPMQPFAKGIVRGSLLRRTEAQTVG
eukprot:11318472-Karenia_brevis.AAC.1